MGAKPWDTPAPEEAGSSTADEIFLSVGRALSAWEVVQDGMQDLFCTLCKASPFALGRAFGVIESVPAKIDMMRYAARESLFGHKELLSRVEALLTEIINFNMRRNDIAHGIVSLVSKQDKQLGFFLIPPHSMSKKIKDLRNLKTPLEDIHGYRFTARQIDNFASEFSRLWSEVTHKVGIEVSRTIR